MAGVSKIAAASDTAESIRKFLKESESQEKLPIGRGVINRAFVAQKFQIPYAATRVEPLNSLFREFNERLSEKGSVASKFDLVVPKVREFLEASFASRSIPARGKKVDRAAISSKFGIARAEFHRHIGLKCLLEEFDRAITGDGLTGSKYDERAEVLSALVRDWLSGKSPVPIYRGKLNRAIVARQLGVEVNTLRLSSRLIEIIEAADQQLADREDGFSTMDRTGRIVLFRPKLAPWVDRHRRSYDFSELADIYSEGLAIRVRDAFLIHRSQLGPGAAKTNYLATLETLKFLARSDAGPEIVDCLNRGVLPDHEVFEQVCHDWRRDRASDHEGRQEITVSAEIKRANSVLRYLATAGVVPRIVDLKPISGARRSVKARKSIAETARERVIRVAQDALHKFAKDRNIEISYSEENHFLAALEQEAAQRADLPDDTISAIRVILSERLGALRSCAERDFLKWEQYWSEGQLLLSKSARANPALQRVEPGQGSLIVESDVELGDFLALVDQDWNGCAPKRSFHSRGLVHSLYRKFGGVYEVEYRLNPHPDAIVAALVMYLHDSGANSSTARTLDVDCLEASQLAGHERITGFKARSNGKPIFTDLAVKHPDYRITTPTALRKVISMTSRYRRNAVDQDKSALFLVRPQSNVIALNDHRLTAWFKEFCARHEELAGFNFLPSMIRPSVLLDLALSKDGGLIAAQYKGHHASGATTGGYVNKYPLLLLYEEKMKSFMNQLQATAISPIHGAAERLGVSAEIAEALLEKAERNGLGVLCLKPRGGIQPGTTQGELCHRPERCLNCVASVVVPEPEAIADMLIFNEVLHRERDRFAAQKNERWEQIWIPWLAFTDVVLSEMGRGPQAKILREARSLVDARRQSGTFEPMGPW